MLNVRVVGDLLHGAWVLRLRLEGASDSLEACVDVEVGVGGYLIIALHYHLINPLGNFTQSLRRQVTLLRFADHNTSKQVRKLTRIYPLSFQTIQTFD